MSLPAGWVYTKLGSICNVVSGGTPKTSETLYWQNGNVPWITPADLSNHTNVYIERGKRNISEMGLWNSSAKLLPKGTVLFSSRAPIGYVAIANNELSTSQGFKNFIPSPAIKPLYLYWYLHKAKNYIISLASGTTFPELSLAKAKEIIIPLAPLEEQEKIISIIQKYFEKFNNIRKHLNNINNIEDTLTQIFLQDSAGNFFRSNTIADFIEERNERVKDNWNHLRRIGVSSQHGIIDLETGNKHSFEKYKIVKPGDIVYNTMRVDIGSIAIYNDFQIAITSPDYVVFRTKKGWSAELLVHYLRTSMGKLEISQHTKGSVRSRLYFSSLKLCRIPLAPLQIQEQAEVAFQKFSSMKVHAKKILDHLSRLEESILEKAFQGELTTQTPEAESAVTLVTRSEKQLVSGNNIALLNKTKPRRKKNMESRRRTLVDIVKALGAVSPEQLYEEAKYSVEFDPESIERFYLDLQRDIENHNLTIVNGHVEAYKNEN